MATAASTTLPYLENRVLMKLFGLSALIGGALGGAVYANRRFASPVDGPPPVVERATLPLVPELSQEREKRSSLARVAAKRPISAILAGMIGGGLGVGVGYKIPEALTARSQSEDLDAQLREREQLFEELLLQEQLQAAGRRKQSSEILDGALDVILDAEVHKHSESMSKSSSSTVTTAVQPLMSADTLGVLLAITGLITGARYGYQHFVNTDPMRAEHDALEQSLDFRLAGSPEGAAAPMPVKIRTDRIGSTPIGGGKSSRSARDVLSRI